ncbi:MAG TPA: hypothetical protein VMU75_08970 [Acidimicrobiales bacterium]|nr:hypothetical protein [Acidimicrobiales bacterium]
MRPPPANFDRSVPMLLFKVGQYPIHHGGVGAIRTLGRVGVPVYAVTEDAATPAAASRYLDGYFVFSTTGTEAEDQLVAGLASIGRQLGRRSVLACTDDEAAVLVAAHRSSLHEWFIMPEVAPALPGRLASKRGVFELCRDLGTPTPDAQFPSTRSELEEFAARATFPVVVKNLEAFTRMRKPVVGASTIVASREDLLALGARWPEPFSAIVQEFIPDVVGEDWIFQAYFNRDSVPLVAFTGVKLRSWPVSAGVTTCGRVLENPRLAAQAIDFCRRVGYRGVVDLDWRLDRRDGEYKLLDFNPRIGAQFRLFETDAGVDVVRALHLDLTGRDVPDGRQANGHRLVVEHLDGPARLAACRSLLEVSSPHRRSETSYAWFASDDPLPFMAMAARFADLVLRRALGLAPSTVRTTAAPGGPARSRGGLQLVRDAIEVLARRAAKPAPATNRSNGPKVGAAARPTKYRPGSDDSNDFPSRGALPVRRRLERRSLSRKPKLSTSMR